ncbi:MAG TPA: DUF4331 family protein, partial [Yinghuangia sp.]|nr:DUF4331 family protein [Yinghuangia sp.]
VLSQLRGADAQDRDAAGRVVVTGQTEQAVTGPTGIRMWAGSAGEPFYIEGNVVTAVRTAVTTGSKLDLSAYNPDTATNLFGDTNVTAIVLEVPATVTGTGSIGFWGTTALPDHHGGWVQINRAATPLINTLFDFTAGGTVDYNASDPVHDQRLFGRQVQDDVAAVVTANGTMDARQAELYGRYVRGILLPDMLRYRIGSTAEFGVGCRNGRGLTEPTPETMFEIVLSQSVPMGLDSGDATGTLRSSFPYLSLPI